MSWAERELKETFRQSLDAPGIRLAQSYSQPNPGTDCPAPEQVWDAVNLKLAPARRLQIVDHTSLCADCAMVWQAALSMTRASELETQSSIAAPQPRPAGWWQNLLRPRYLGPILGGAAALLMVVVLNPPTTSLETLPQPQPSGVLRGAGDPGPTLLANAGPLSPGDTLNWSPVAEADGYLVTITDSQGNGVQQVVAEAKLTLDSILVEPLHGTGVLTWSVEVVGGSASGARSLQQSFTFRGPMK